MMCTKHEEMNITDVTMTMDRRLTPSKSYSRFNGEDSVVIKDGGWQYSAMAERDHFATKGRRENFSKGEDPQDQNLY